MPVRKAEAQWEGDLRGGRGRMKFGSGAFDGQYSFSSRFEEGPGTNPEELLGAAHAGCFSMAFASNLSKAGFVPQRVHTVANVRIEKVGDGFKITRIDLQTDAVVPGISDEQFQQIGEAAKKGCPVSQALAATEITLQAKLVSA
jgi:lipoyl-dependent peroxiredoxin